MSFNKTDNLILEYHDELIRLMDLCFMEGRFPGSNRLAIKVSMDGLHIALRQLLDEIAKKS